MTQQKRVFVIGLGLIGGSLALAVRKNSHISVIGYDRNPIAVEQALALSVIDYGVESIEEGVIGADLIIIATPVDTILKIIQQLSSLKLKDDVIITDAGSTKRMVVEMARQTLPKEVTFIGGHPMAGSHKSGVFAAKRHLFENAFYFLTPDADVARERVETLKDYLLGTKATFLNINPELHDKVVGVISHFPHIVASALVHQLANFPDEGLGIARLAAGGFRDITRIASSDPIMWQDICLHNRDILLHLFERWEEEMGRIKSSLLNNDREGIKAFFDDAKQYRDHIPVRQKGVLPSYYDLYVDVPDYPGIIAKVTEIIAVAGISITNIQILELRENILGVLRITFQSDQAREEASVLLNAHNYKTYIDD